MDGSSIRYISFPRTEPPPYFAEELVAAFRKHEAGIGTNALAKGLTSDQVMQVLREDLIELGFEVEASKHTPDKIERPVFFGEGGQPTLKYEVDAFNPSWQCGLEIEAGRAWMGNAVYRDLIQAMVMVRALTMVLVMDNNRKE